MEGKTPRKSLPYRAGRLFGKLVPMKGLPDTYSLLPEGNYPPWLRAEMRIARKARLPEQIFEDVRRIADPLQRAKRLAAHALNESTLRKPSPKAMEQIAMSAERHLDHTEDPYTLAHADANVLLRMGLSRVHSQKVLDEKWAPVNKKIYSVIRRISMGK